MRVSFLKLAVGVSTFSIVGSVGSAAMAEAINAESLIGPALVYSESNGLTTLDSSDDYQGALDGLGNVELGGQTDDSSVADFENATVLKGSFMDGSTISLSSMTKYDWFGEDGTTGYGEDDVANQWFSTMLSETGLNNVLAQYNAAAPLFNLQTYTEAEVFDEFYTAGGFQRFSDPNIDFVRQDGNGVAIGLAGHLNASIPVSQFAPQFAGFFNSVQMSEVVRVDYNGTTQYLYSFAGDGSGVVSDDGTFSHTATFTVVAEGTDDVTDVPEPATGLALLLAGVTGFGYIRKFNAA